MMGSSHALSGAAAWLAGSWALEASGAINPQTPLELAVGTAVCAGGALLPDLDQHDLAGESLYRILGEDYGYWIDKASQVLWGESATPEFAELLAAPAHTPLLVFRRHSSAAGRPIEEVVSRYRGDRYQQHMELRSDMLPSQ